MARMTKAQRERRAISDFVGCGLCNYDVSFGLRFLEVNDPAAHARAVAIILTGSDAERAALATTLAADSPHVEVG